MYSCRKPLARERTRIDFEVVGNSVGFDEVLEAARELVEAIERRRRHPRGHRVQNRRHLTPTLVLICTQVRHRHMRIMAKTYRG